MMLRPLFLSTPSVRRATNRSGQETTGKNISIHALREEGDLLPQQLVQHKGDFYPRPP